MTHNKILSHVWYQAFKWTISTLSPNILFLFYLPSSCSFWKLFCSFCARTFCGLQDGAGHHIETMTKQGKMGNGQKYLVLKELCWSAYGGRIYWRIMKTLRNICLIDTRSISSDWHAAWCRPSIIGVRPAATCWWLTLEPSRIDFNFFVSPPAVSSSDHHHQWEEGMIKRICGWRTVCNFTTWTVSRFTKSDSPK